jgi:hypothetical protein
MEFEAIRIGIVLAGCLVATYYDLFKNRNVPNLLTYSMVGLGILFSIWDFVLNFVLSPSAPPLFSSAFFFSAALLFGPAIVLFIFGYYLYISGQIGGADILVFVSIALLMPQQPASPFIKTSKPLVQIPYVFWIFIVSGVLFSAATFVSYFPKILRGIAQKKIKLEIQKLLMAVFFLVLYGFVLWSTSRFVPPIYLAITALVFVSAFFVYMFRDFIMDEYIIRMVPFEKIEEEDVLAIEKMDPKLVKKYKLQKLLSSKELEKLKGLPLKEYPIYQNLPCFMPYILAAVIITLITGDIFLFLLKVA